MTKTSLSALALYPLFCILFLPPSPQSAQAQLLIPVSSIPSYNQSMDTNTVLVNTYKKFPYPSVSEILGLSAQTKFSEEQIKIWFSAQRLKHGVSWTPEEVLFLLDSCLSYTRVKIFGGHSVFNCAFLNIFSLIEYICFNCCRSVEGGACKYAFYCSIYIASILCI